MDYCYPCRRHLNGALACPGCGARVVRYDPAPPYSAAGPDAPETPDELIESEAPDPAVGGDSPVGGRAADRRARRGRKGHAPGRDRSRGHGRRARRGRGRRITLLALSLGVGLAALSVAELGESGLPWVEPAGTPVSREPIAESGESGTDSESPSSGAPDASASKSSSSTESPESSERGSAEPSAKPAKKTPATSQPPPAQPPPPPPPSSTQAPDPPPTRPPPPDNPPPSECFLFWCR